MKMLRSHVQGKWHEPSSEGVPLVDPCTEEVIARASSEGIDFEAALSFARGHGRAALQELHVAQRAGLLDAMSKRLYEHREELIDLSLRNSGTTRKDAKFDVDGGLFTLSHYASLGKSIGDRRYFIDGDGIQLGRSARFWGQHVLVPLAGAAVHINAFNFPIWGLAEKAACALLAGLPVLSKPATSTALVTYRAVEILVDAGVLPDGALSLICGSTGDLLDRLGPQDVVAFTGSADTARSLRAKPNLIAAGTRFNVEADSLNAAVLAPEVEPSTETWSVFLRDVTREITQKTGQKCTAVRRIFVAREQLEAVRDALCERLSEVVVGNPADPSVTMGPLATEQQLRDAVRGVALLRQDGAPVFGSGERVDGVGNDPGKGFFFGPTLLLSENASGATNVHEHEVFGPVSTLMPYDGSARQAAELVALGGGSLVTSVYSNDAGFLGRFLAHGGSTSGRLYVGSEKVAGQLPGSGVAMPQVLHGGPGRAGGGEELGGLRGLSLYLQRVALTGDRALIERLAGSKGE